MSQPDPKHPKPQSEPPRGVAVEVTASDPPRRAPLLLAGAGLLAAGALLGGWLRPPAEPREAAAAPPAATPAEPAPAPAAPTAPAAAEPDPSPSPAPRTPARPRVEVVFAVDTTGSMGGLLRATKKKVWSVVNELADARPTPRIALGLVAYRDDGDRYVTRATPLTEDLDAFYEDLQALKARGGGDEPERVDQGLSAALDGLRRGCAGWGGAMGWSEDALARLLFLVGDAPPHADGRQACLDLASQARGAGVVVNAIQCGEAAETGRMWSLVAACGGGEALRIDQQATVTTVTTPLDAPIAAAQRRIEATVLPSGTGAQQAQVARQVASNTALPQEAYASRACAQWKTGSYYGHDLLFALEGGRVELGELPAAELPPALRELDPAGRVAFVEGLKAERAAARAELAGLVAERDAWLRSGQAGQARDAFDRQVLETLRRQLRGAGLTFPAR